MKLHKIELTNMERKTVDDNPSATSYSPRSFGRVKLFSNEDVNILKQTEMIKLTVNK